MGRRLVSLLFLIAAACDGDGGVSVADLPHWSVEAVPLLELGAEDTRPTEFGAVSGAALLANGGLAVADRLNHHVRIFDVSGKEVRRIGGEGDGPGEFRIPLDLDATESGIAVWDSRLQRMTLFSEGGELLATQPFRQAPGVIRFVRWKDTTDEVFLIRANSVPPPGEARGVTSLDLWIGDLGSGVLEETLSVPYGMFVRLEDFPEGRGGLVTGIPFGPRGIVAVTDSILYYSDGESPRVTGFSASGEELFDLNLELERIALPPTARAEWEEGRREQFDDGARAEHYLAVIEDEVGWPTHGPLLDAGLGDGEGNGWFRIWNPDGPDEWIGINPEGRPFAVLSGFPEGAPLQLEADRILMISWDAVERERISVHRLVKAQNE